MPSESGAATRNTTSDAPRSARTIVHGIRVHPVEGGAEADARRIGQQDRMRVSVSQTDRITHVINAWVCMCREQRLCRSSGWDARSTGGQGRLDELVFT